jgi:hypothetical protein
MSELLGALALTGKGGNELFVYDDCLVRASTGLLATLTGGDFSSLLGQSEAPGSPDELVMRHPDNRMVRRQDIRSATLAKGRWPASGLRRLTVNLHSGTVVTYDWPGDTATRRLNNDAYAASLLTSALHELLEVRLP